MGENGRVITGGHCVDFLLIPIMPTTIVRPRRVSAISTHRQDLKTELDELEGKLAALQQKIQTIKGAEFPRLILLELHDQKNGRIDAQRLADFMAVPLKRLAEGVELNYKAVHRDPSGESFQEALRPVKRSLEYLHELFQKPATIRVWLNTPHPMLDGKTSLETIMAGKAFAIERLLGNAWDGVVS